MVVGHDGHHRRPYDIEDGQVMGLIEFVETGAFRLAQSSQHGSRIGDCPRDHVAHMFVRFVGRERSPAIGGELLEIEHRRPWSIANPANSPGGEEDSPPSSAASLRCRGRTYCL